MVPFKPKINLSKFDSFNFVHEGIIVDGTVYLLGDKYLHTIDLINKYQEPCAFYYDTL